MPNHEQVQFLAGVIEGFYGQPWTPDERFEMLRWLSEAGLNTYFYCPKADLHQRAVWREPYPAADTAHFRQLLAACRERKLHFIYALSPGLDIRYREATELNHLQQRFQQMLELGCESFALLFDDIPDRMEPGDLEQFGSLAAAQGAVTNRLFQWLREQCPGARLLFCPTPYCSRMVQHQHGGAGYLPTIGQVLAPEIEVLWTGPEIISSEITVAHIQELESVLQRKPMIWDNLHANDYDGHRFFCGPYAGRPLELRGAVRGLLSNPNTEFPLNFVPVRTLGAFVNCRSQWDPRAAYLAAIQEWLPHFAKRGHPISLEDLVTFGDCYYLPHEEGPEADALYRAAQALMTANPGTVAGLALDFQERATRLREFCGRVTELNDRQLFYALSRRIWELGEELDLLKRFADYQSGKAPASDGFRSDFHLPRLYRGGIVERLQRLLTPHPDGTFTPSPTPS